MEKYQIIPRKFRPKTFSEVAGHEAIVTTIKNALATKHLGQAYLFCGTRGCGKTTLARLLAKALNCENVKKEFEPCNACSSCLEITNGQNLDIIEIDGASNRGIDDIRQINETVSYAPQKGRYKIYIIDEVHMLTKEAFNALLKTLEEPPETVKFFFATTEPHKIPQTIISRCQRFNLGRIPEEALVAKLTSIAQTLNIEIEKAALVEISHLSEGSLRDAQSLLDQLICYGKTPITLDLTREVFGLISNDHLQKLDACLKNQDIDEAISLAKQLYLSGRDIGALLESLLEHFRNHLQNPKAPFPKSSLLNLLDTLIEWQAKIHKTPFKQVHLEMLFITLIKTQRKLTLDNLIERLLDLENRLEKSPTKKPEPKKTIKPEASTPPPPKIIEKVPNEKPVKAEPPVALPKITEKAPEPIEQASKEELSTCKYDTLVRFAAVELEGTYTQ